MSNVQNRLWSIFVIMGIFFVVSEQKICQYDGKVAPALGLCTGPTERVFVRRGITNRTNRMCNLDGVPITGNTTFCGICVPSRSYSNRYFGLCVTGVEYCPTPKCREALSLQSQPTIPFQDCASGRTCSEEGKCISISDSYRGACSIHQDCEGGKFCIRGQCKECDTDSNIALLFSNSIKLPQKQYFERVRCFRGHLVPASSYWQLREADPESLLIILCTVVVLILLIVRCYIALSQAAKKERRRSALLLLGVVEEDEEEQHQLPLVNNY